MKFLYPFAVCLFLFQSALAQENYPELMVAPRASERLKREAVEESKGTFTTHLPVLISGLTTLGAGIASHADLDKGKDSEGIGPKIAMVVGGSWVAASLWMQMSYKPYLRGFSEVKKMPTQSTRDQLAAERMAEEHIDEAARLTRKLKWLSFGTNLLGSGYALSSAKEDSAGQAMAIVGLAGAFVPLLFPNQAEQVSDDQRSYKKKVFGPVTFGNGLLVDPVRNRLVPGLSAVTYF